MVASVAGTGSTAGGRKPDTGFVPGEVAAETLLVADAPLGYGVSGTSRALRLTALVKAAATIAGAGAAVLVPVADAVSAAGAVQAATADRSIHAEAVPKGIAAEGISRAGAGADVGVLAAGTAVVLAA